MINVNMVPETISLEWHAFAELVTAVVLVAVVVPQSQSLYRRLIRTAATPPSYAAPELAYADSALLRPGEAPTLRHGDEYLELDSDYIPTMLRHFEELSLSEDESSNDATEPIAVKDPVARLVSTPSPASPEGLTGVHGVHSLSSHSKSARSTSEGSVSPPSPPDIAKQPIQPSSETVQKLHLSQFEPIVLPPPPVRSATTHTLRFTSAPPPEPLTPLTEDMIQAAVASASASNAPKAKGKGRLQTSASVSTRGFATPDRSIGHGRPTTRSMSAAPGPSTLPSAIDRSANTIDELPVDSYLRHSTKRAAWFESKSDVLIAHPPDFSSRKDVELEDVFIHRVKDTYQLWIWEKDNTGRAVWKRIWLGYARPSDGRKLTVTPARKEPSWVSEQWASKTAKKRAP